MAITAIMGAGAGKLKLTETLKSSNGYTWGDTSVTTSAKHKYVLAVVNHQQFNTDTRDQNQQISFSAGEEIVENKTLGDGSTTDMANISIFRNVPAGTTISYAKSWRYATTVYLQAYCFD